MAIVVLRDEKSGDVVQTFAFKCGQCRQDSGAQLTLLVSDEVPYDLLIRCNHCFAVVGTFNPSPEAVAAAVARRRD